MSATTHPRADDRTAIVLFGLIASVLLHAALLSWANGHPVKVEVPEAPLDFQLVPVELPKQAPVEPPQKTIRPVAKAPAVKAKPVPIAPAPNPEPAEKPAEPAPVMIGIRLPATTGTFRAPLGNTPLGPMSERASDPRAAGCVQDSEPRLLQDFKSPYPDDARHAGISGTVRLRLSIDAEGRVTDAQVLAGQGHGLDEAALAAVRKFKYRPATRGCVPAPSTTIHAYTFELD